MFLAADFKSIVKSVSTRISRLSANEGIFRSHEDYYNEALAKAGYSDKILYLDKQKRVDCRNKVDKSGEPDKLGDHLKIRSIGV